MIHACVLSFPFSSLLHSHSGLDESLAKRHSITATHSLPFENTTPTAEVLYSVEGSRCQPVPRSIYQVKAHPAQTTLGASGPVVGSGAGASFSLSCPAAILPCSQEVTATCVQSVVCRKRTDPWTVSFHCTGDRVSAKHEYRVLLLTYPCLDRLCYSDTSWYFGI